MSRAPLAHLDTHRNMFRAPHTSRMEVDMSRVKLRYAVHFDSAYFGEKSADYPGYLLVNVLSSGDFGVTMLVYSLLDHQVYVRKAHDVQEHEGNQVFQCRDARYLVPHPNIPQLHGIQERLVQGREKLVVCSFSTWQYCNSGTVNALHQALIEKIMENVSDDECTTPVELLPEACLWKWLATMSDIFLTIHGAGVAHRDCHGWNWFLHSTTSPPQLPDLFLGDFGEALPYPQITNPTCDEPFQGHLNLSLSARENNVSPPQFKELLAWYFAVMKDVTRAAVILEMFVELSDTYKPPNDQRPQEYLRTFRSTLSAWSDAVRNLWHKPTLMRQIMERLHFTIVAQAKAHMDAYAACNKSMDWSELINEPPVALPAMWKDPTSLLDPTKYHTPNPPPPPAASHPSSSPSSSFDYSRGENLLATPYIDVQAPGMDEPVRLRAGQFRVVEVVWDQSAWFDQAGGNWHPTVLRFVGSLDDVDVPLSPESPWCCDKDDDVAMDPSSIPPPPSYPPPCSPPPPPPHPDDDDDGHTTPTTPTTTVRVGV